MYLWKWKIFTKYYRWFSFYNSVQLSDKIWSKKSHSLPFHDIDKETDIKNRVCYYFDDTINGTKLILVTFCQTKNYNVL